MENTEETAVDQSVSEDTHPDRQDLGQDAGAPPMPQTDSADNLQAEETKTSESNATSDQTDGPSQREDDRKGSAESSGADSQKQKASEKIPATAENHLGSENNQSVADNATKNTSSTSGAAVLTLEPEPDDGLPDEKVNDPSPTPSKLAGKTSPAKVSSEPAQASTKFIYILSALTTVGGFLLGYDIGIVAGSMLFIQPYFKLSTFWQEAIVSGLIGAAAVAALMSGWLTDRIGRKLTIMTSCVVFAAGSVLMGSAPTKEVLLMGRIVAGLGVGLASVVVPIYVAEASPTHIRGRLVSFHQMLINTGIVVSSLLAGGFSYVKPDGWRYMLGMAAVPAVLQFVGFSFMPESPRWLVGRGRIEEAESVLKRMRGGADVTAELQEISRTIEEERKDSVGGIQHFVKILTTQQVRRALFVGCALLFFQQWCGINTVIYYSGTLLKMAGFPVTSAIWLVAVPNVILFVSFFIGLFLVEKLGRRPLLIGSLAGSILGLVILAVGFHLAGEDPAPLNITLVEQYSNGTEITTCTQEFQTCSSCVKSADCGYCFTDDATSGSCLPAFDERRSSAGRCVTSESTTTDVKWAYEFCPSDYTWIALIGMAVFVFAFSPGLGPMPWTINSEIYPLWARSTCNSLAACTAWVCNLVISFTFLTMTETISIHGTFWLFAAITAGGVVFMVFMLPETKNKTLEEMEELFMTSTRRRQRADVELRPAEEKTTVK